MYLSQELQHKKSIQKIIISLPHGRIRNETHWLHLFATTFQKNTSLRSLSLYLDRKESLFRIDDDTDDAEVESGNEYDGQLLHAIIDGLKQKENFNLTLGSVRFPDMQHLLDLISGPMCPRHLELDLCDFFSNQPPKPQQSSGAACSKIDSLSLRVGCTGDELSPLFSILPRLPFLKCLKLSDFTVGKQELLPESFFNFLERTESLAALNLLWLGNTDHKRFWKILQTNKTINDLSLIFNVGGGGNTKKKITISTC